MNNKKIVTIDFDMNMVIADGLYFLLSTIVYKVLLHPVCMWGATKLIVIIIRGCRTRGKKQFTTYNVGSEIE